MAKQDKDTGKPKAARQTVPNPVPNPVSKLPNLLFAVVICLQLLTMLVLTTVSTSKSQPVIVQVPMQQVSVVAQAQPLGETTSQDVAAAVVKEEPTSREIRIFSNGSVETVTVD